jgi:uncharacterized membrane-anchored protein YjiN (DUF445 family)
MRVIATLLLLLMTGIFIATTAVRIDWFWIPYVRAFAEAGMVGACADWFAVVALFRHPLGLPIPHTAIVPRNKERIGPALGRFITGNFLNTKVAHERLARIDLVGWIKRWLDNPANTARLGRNVGLMLPQILSAVPAAEIRELLAGIARYGIESVPAAPLASRLLALAWAHGEAQAVLDQALDFAREALARNKDAISQKVSEKSSRWIPRWVDNLIAERVMNGLLATMSAMHDPAHPWRIELRNAVERLIADLATDPGLYARLCAGRGDQGRAARKPAAHRTSPQPMDRDRERSLRRAPDTGRVGGARDRPRAEQSRPLAGKRAKSPSPPQPLDSARRPARIAAAPRRDRGLCVAGRAELGHRNAGQQA